MIRVAYDYQIFSLQKYGGISRYFANLALHLSQNPEFQVKIEAGLYKNEYISSDPRHIVKGFKVKSIPKVNKIIQTLNYWSNQVSFTLDKPDIVHETFYQKPSTLARSSHLVTTVHDMIEEKFNNYKGKNNFISTRRLAIESADRVICVSENTKQDLLKILNVNPDKVDVVYLGHFTPDFGSATRSSLKNPYILFVGERNNYKNFHRLVKAYASNKQIIGNFDLVCCGINPFSLAEKNLFAELKIDVDRIKYIAGDDSVLANLYRNADAFVYPSLYEGFGIPPLEAMSYGCPAICSNTSSIPEVVADAAEYFDPYDLDSMSAAIEKVLFSPSRQEQLVQKGRERVKFFSWEKCAAETGNVYRKLVG